MHRVASATLRRVGRPITGLVVLAAVVTLAHAQKPSAACKLLEVGEIESALGGKASTKPAGENQSAPGLALDECKVEMAVPQHGTRRVAVRVVKDLPVDAADALLSRYLGMSRERQWKETGARFEQKTVGSATCVIYERPGVVGHASCSIPRGKGYLEVEVTASLHELPAIETVGALIQKASSRW